MSCECGSTTKVDESEKGTEHEDPVMECYFVSTALLASFAEWSEPDSQPQHSTWDTILHLVLCGVRIDIGSKNEL